MTPIKFCPTGKAAFPDAKSAWDEVKRLRKMPPELHPKGYAPKGIYECEKCGFWHMTSQKQRQKKRKSV